MAGVAHESRREHIDRVLEADWIAAERECQYEPGEENRERDEQSREGAPGQIVLPLRGHRRREEGRKESNKSIPPMGRVLAASVMAVAWPRRGSSGATVDKVQFNTSIDGH